MAAFFIPMFVMVPSYVMTVRLLSQRAKFVRNNSLLSSNLNPSSSTHQPIGSSHSAHQQQQLANHQAGSSSNGSGSGINMLAKRSSNQIVEFTDDHKRPSVEIYSALCDSDASKNNQSKATGTEDNSMALGIQSSNELSIKDANSNQFRCCCNRCNNGGSHNPNHCKISRRRRVARNLEEATCEDKTSLCFVKTNNGDLDDKSPAAATISLECLVNKTGNEPARTRKLARDQPSGKPNLDLNCGESLRDVTHFIDEDDSGSLLLCRAQPRSCLKCRKLIEIADCKKCLVVASNCLARSHNAKGIKLREAEGPASLANISSPIDGHPNEVSATTMAVGRHGPPNGPRRISSDAQASNGFALPAEMETCKKTTGGAAKNDINNHLSGAGSDNSSKRAARPNNCEPKQLADSGPERVRLGHDIGDDDADRNSSENCSR